VLGFEVREMAEETVYCFRNGADVNVGNVASSVTTPLSLAEEENERLKAENERLRAALKEDEEAATARIFVAEQEVERLRAAMAVVRASAGAVCPDFEMCAHAPCASSYAAWQIAEAALGGDSGRE
jgi:hypothetical protein